MTARPAPELAGIASRCRHLLLGFDGPVCAVFAGLPASAAAHELRLALSAAGAELPGDILELDDPLEMFRVIARRQPAAARLAHRELTRLEDQAVAAASPAGGATELITAAKLTGRTVTVVTDYSSEAVALYLDMHRLYHHVTAVAGRDGAGPDQIGPGRVRAAVSLLRAAVEQCVFIGGSVPDVLAAKQAGLPVIGYAGRPGEGGALTRAGADAVTTTLGEIRAALRAVPAPAPAR